MYTKDEYRRAIRQWKKNNSREKLDMWSREIIKRVERDPRFLDAKTVAVYWSLPDEVTTHEFIRNWSEKKMILLPVILSNNSLALKRYMSEDGLCTGPYSICEPQGENIDPGLVELILVPGIGFGRDGSRIGRGRGYYDRLLPAIHGYKIGLGYSFQVFDSVPTDAHDVFMDDIISERP